MHDAIPESASEPDQRRENGRLYQPPWSGGRAAATATPVGGVASKRKPNAIGAEVLPAPSVHVPLGPTLALSGPAYVVELHDAIPETGSAPLQAIVRYQPMAPAA